MLEDFFYSFWSVLGLLNYEYLDLFLGLLIIILVSILTFVPNEDKKESSRPVLFSFLNQGFVLFLFGVYKVFKPEDTSFLWTIVSFQLVFFLFFSNPIQRFLSPILVFVFSGVLLFEYKILLFTPLLTTVCLSLLYFYTLPKRLPEKFESLPYSLSVSLLCLAGFSFFPEFKQTPEISEIQSIIIFIAGCVLFYTELDTKTNSLTIVSVILFFGLIFFPTLETPGIMAFFFSPPHCLCKGLPFPILFSMVFLILFYFGFYYDLDTSLLEKSKMMLTSSLLFFVTYVCLRFSPLGKKR